MMTLVPNPKANYNNLYGAFKTIIKTERPRALFRGITVVATGAGPAHALYFSTYEYSKRWLSRHYNNIMSQGGCGFEWAGHLITFIYRRSCCNSDPTS